VLRPSPDSSPKGPIDIKRLSAADFITPPESGLRITLLGHSTTLVEIDGSRVLTDPVWSERASPAQWTGVRRWHEPPLALSDLPTIDVVLISHDHYDHLDHTTIVALKDKVGHFVVPLGVGSHLEYWGVSPARITELDWWEEAKVGNLILTSTPARHSSGRYVLDKDRTLWSGYAIAGRQHRVFFSGDTGLHSEVAEIGRRLGPFDASLIEVGEYNAAWRDWHSGPEQAVFAHRTVGARLFIPMHWGLFKLAPHTWTEPIERAVVAALKEGVKVTTPRPGESIEPERAPGLLRWWPSLSWQSAEQAPIVSTLDGRRPSRK